MTIIALSGKARVGKDTFASVLTERYSFNRVAIAEPLRDLCSKVFYIPLNMFTDDDKKDERMQRVYIDFHDIDKIREIVQNEWNYNITADMRTKMEELHGVGMDTPRDVLRTIGNMLREVVDSNIWINLALYKIKELGGKIVITDARFENEREVFRQLGAVLVLIKRNDDGTNKEHEFSLGEDSDYDAVFENNETIQSFKSSIDIWYNTKQHEFIYYKVWRYE